MCLISITVLSVNRNKLSKADSLCYAICNFEITSPGTIRKRFAGVFQILHEKNLDKLDFQSMNYILQAYIFYVTN